MPPTSDSEIEQIITQAKELLARYGASNEAELPSVKQSLLPLIQKMVEKAQQCFQWEELGKSLKLNKVVLAASRILQSRRGEAVTLYNMGLLYQKMERHQESVDCFLQACQIEREQGDLKNEASSLKRIAELYLKLGQPEVSLLHLQRLLAIQKELGDTAGETATREIIDIIQEEMGQ